eukprot:SAG11_NODE_20399_length_446_cov_0.743516_1_plen_69_part_10
MALAAMRLSVVCAAVALLLLTKAPGPGLAARKKMAKKHKQQQAVPASPPDNRPTDAEAVAFLQRGKQLA